MEEVARERAFPRLRLAADASGPLRAPLAPTPALGMFLSIPALLPKGKPLGAPSAPPSLPGNPGWGEGGRTPGFLPPPIPERNSSEVPSGSGFPK